MALFCFCATYDIPYDAVMEFDGWEDYREKMGVGSYFSDGIMDVREVIDSKKSEPEKWEEVWGIGNSESPYTDEDYKRLDRLFANYTERLVAQGGYDARQEDTLRNCCIMRLQADKLIAIGDKDSISAAKSLNSMIEANLSSENLRKKDEKMDGEVKLDGIVEALQRKYGVTKDLSYEQAVQVCSEWLMGHHYNITRDAADHALLAIINCTRSNDGMQELQELPEDASFDRRFVTEFDDEATQAEMDVYEYLGETRFIPRSGADV